MLFAQTSLADCTALVFDRWYDVAGPSPLLDDDGWPAHRAAARLARHQDPAHAARHPVGLATAGRPRTAGESAGGAGLDDRSVHAVGEWGGGEGLDDRSVFPQRPFSVLMPPLSHLLCAHASLAFATTLLPLLLWALQQVVAATMAGQLGISGRQQRDPGHGLRASQDLAVMLLRLSVGMGRVGIPALHAAVLAATSADELGRYRCVMNH